MSRPYRYRSRHSQPRRNQSVRQTSSEQTLRRSFAHYQTPIVGHSTWQIVSSLVLFIAVCALMYVGVDHRFWPALLCSLLTLTHYGHWRRQHSCHHANWNNLDRRESGVDIYSKCLTVAEYCDLSPLGRYAHRLSRHPVVLFVLLPPVVFLAIYRLPFGTPPSWRKERRSVHATNLAVVASAVALGLLLGFPEVAIVQLPVIALAACIGAWLFFVQHQFEHTSWLRADKWGSMTASLRGSSHLLLPGVLRWFTGNIGLHHLHHLNPRIPNYRLTQCHAENTSLSDGVSLGSRGAWRATLMRLWDEEAGKMVRFRDVGKAARPAPRVVSTAECEPS